MNCICGFFINLTRSIEHVAICKDTKIITLVDCDDNVYIVNSNSQNHRHIYSLHNENTSFSNTSSGRVVIWRDIIVVTQNSQTNESSIYVIKISPRPESNKLHVSGKLITSLVINASFIVWGREDGVIEIKAIHSNNPYLYTRYAHKNAVLGLAIDDNYLASGSADGIVKVWDLENGHCIAIFDVGNEVDSVAIRDSILVSGDASGVVKIWNLHTRECMHTLENYHSCSVYDLAIGWDYTIVSGSPDEVIVWKPGP